MCVVITMTLMTGYTVGVGSTSYFGVKNENQSWMQHSIIIINYVIIEFTL